MKRIFYALSLLAISPAAVLAQKAATGYVYNDDNGNGKREAKEKGVANVTVSNGKEVVLTDTKGKYTLPIGDDNIIFVIKPAGYKVPLNAKNQPQYYYIHKPAGSPAEYEYKGVAPTGALPASVDFAVMKYNEPDNYRALVLGDPQVLEPQDVGFFDKGIMSELVDVKNVAFGLTLGDLVGKVLTMHKDYINVVAKANVPWYNVIGNHDTNHEAKSIEKNDESFEASFGPSTYSYNYGQAHYIVLNDNLYPDPRDGKGLWGGFLPDQLSFIENDLKYVDTGKLVVLAFHIPLYQAEGAFRTEDRERLFSLLAKYPHVLALSAHTHNQWQRFYDKEWGWTGAKPFHEFNVGATCGNWYSGRMNEQGVLESVMSDGTPRGYAYLNITGNTYTADYKVANKPADYQIGLWHRKVMSTIWWDGRGFVYANFYMGYKDSKVRYRIDDGKWKPMKYTLEPDPAFVDELYKWDGTENMFRGRRPTEPANCTHLWKAPLPESIGIGTHQIEVEATDPFGRTFTQKSTYRIEEAKF